MSQGKTRPRDKPVLPAGYPGLETLPEEFLAPLFTPFPDPILITNGSHEVVFLNRAATEVLGDTVLRGDPCPICSQMPGWLSRETGQHRPRRCLKNGETINRLPLHLPSASGTLLSFTVSASPIRTSGEELAGCLIVLRDLHEDLLAHPEVQLQLATLSSILENFPTPFFMVDPDLVITHINERMEKLTGYSRHEVVGRSSCDAVLNTSQCHTEDCVLKQVMAQKRPISGLRRVVRDRQGREIPVVVYASIITDPTGRVVGGFEAVRDISAIIEAERKISLITELTQEGILMADGEQRVLFANSKMAQVLGRSKEELIGLHLGEVLTPQHAHMAAELTRKVKEGSQVETQFCSTLDQAEPESENPRVFETCMAVSRLGENPLACIYLRDLTRRVEMERELQKTNTFLHNIIRCSVDGIVVVDVKGNPLIFNDGAELILGYKAEEVIGHPEVFFKFYPSEVAFEMMRRMRSDDYGPPDKLTTTQITFIHKNGEEVPVNFSAAIVRERGQEVASVGIFSDLREHLQMRRELEESRAQLIHSEKIASLGRLAAGVAHEINNPLAGILIYAELLQRELTREQEERQHVEEIIAQTLRCRQIVTRLLEFSRQSLGDRRLFDLNEIIVRCVELLSHQASFHNITITQNLDPDLPQIIGDPGQLQQVFTNLLLNAADAMSSLGHITINSRPTPENHGVTLTFTDTGRGIPPEIRDKIFEPFFTTKPPGKGTGLGLSIVYGVIQRHGGSISVDCPPHGGTTFTIRLPLDYQPTQQEDWI